MSRHKIALATFPDAEVCWMFGPNLCLMPEALERMPSLKALLRSGSGLDALPCDWAKAHGIGVYNTPKSIAESVAEHAVALLVSYIRQVPHYNARTRRSTSSATGLDWSSRGQAPMGDFTCKLRDNLSRSFPG